MNPPIAQSKEDAVAMDVSPGGAQPEPISVLLVPPWRERTFPNNEWVLLLVLLSNRLVKKLSPGPVLVRAVIAAVVGGGVVALLLALPLSARQPLVMGVGALGLGALAALPLIWKELRLLLHADGIHAADGIRADIRLLPVSEGRRLGGAECNTNS